MVTMKRGVFARDDRFLGWYKSVGDNRAKRTTVTTVPNN
jgi:hypothetical protein